MVQRFRNLNWKYALGEILLIFIGISLSLFFDEWRTDRSDRIKERELLIELRESIVRDTIEVAHQIKLCQRLIKTSDYLIANLQKVDKINDSISYCLGWITTSFGMKADYSGYRNIVATGFPIISDHELRRQIIDYYIEADRLNNWNDMIGKRIEQIYGPMILKHFDEFTRQENSKPINFDALKTDREFMFHLKKSNELQRVTLEGVKGFKTLYTNSMLNFLPRQ